MDLSTSYTIKAKVTGQDQIAGLKGGLDKLKKSSNGAATAMGKLKNMAGQAFGALRGLAPVLGIAGMGKLVNDTLELGDMLQKLSVTSGVSVEMLDKLRISSQLAGTDFKALQRAFPVLAKNMQDASDGVGTAKEAFDRIGFSAVDSAGNLKSMDEALLEISDLMMKTKDDTLNLANANEIFGGGVGRKLVPLLKEGREAILGISNAFNQADAESMAAFNDRVTLLGERFNVLKVQLTKALLPAFEKIVQILTFAATKFAALPAPIKGISVALALIAPIGLGLVPILAGLIFSFKTIATLKMGIVLTKIATGFGAIITAVKGAAIAFAPFAPAGLIATGIIALGVFIFKFRDEIVLGFRIIGTKIKELIAPIVNFVGNVFNTAVNVARNAFNRLPNIVQNIIKIATLPIRSFIDTIKKALGFLNIFKGAKNKNKETGTTELLKSTAPSTTAAITRSASPSFALPRSLGYQETDFSFGNIGSSRGLTSSAGISEIRPNQIPRRSSAIQQSASRSRRKTPNININTGAVTQMENKNYVTTQDLANAVQSSVAQTMNYIEAGGERHYLGM
tara:strand:- start:6203 stop:7903 length:1701 start_codon:yes stop_codon:yes gene_type:complete